ncbi:CRE-PHY-3 protein, partial [Aphelenchoides avenae]
MGLGAIAATAKRSSPDSSETGARVFADASRGSTMRSLAFLALLSSILACHSQRADKGNSRHFEFEGKYRWHDHILDLCDSKETISFEEKGPEHLCYVYRILLFFVKVEVVSTRLPAVVYHQFLPRSQIERFLRMVDHVNIAPLTVQAKPDKDGQRTEDSRIANGTFLDHHGYPETTEMFAYIQTRINAFNFKFAEMFQVLAYVPGGHYAPHYDYFLQNWDVEELGNRIATFMPVLQTAEDGG